MQAELFAWDNPGIRIRHTRVSLPAVILIKRPAGSRQELSTLPEGLILGCCIRVPHPCGEQKKSRWVANKEAKMVHPGRPSSIPASEVHLPRPALIFSGRPRLFVKNLWDERPPHLSLVTGVGFAASQ